MIKLTYEEWREKFHGTVSISDDVRKELKEFHDIDADAEIELAIRKEYEFYLNFGVEE